MVIHWEIRILRQAVTFETLYLRAQMEFEGMVRKKNQSFLYSQQVARIGWHIEHVFKRILFAESFFL